MRLFASLATFSQQGWIVAVTGTTNREVRLFITLYAFVVRFGVSMCFQAPQEPVRLFASLATFSQQGWIVAVTGTTNR